MKHSILPAVVDLGGPSATLAINEHSNALKAQGRTIYKFGLGQSPFPVPASVVQALTDHAHEKDYLPVQGLLALREAVAGYHARLHDLELGADDIFVGPGSKELMFLLQLVFTGETLLPTPCWVSYLPQALISGRPVTLLASSFENRWRLSADRLDEHCWGVVRPRLMFLNYPGNPDGLTYSAGELEALAEVLRRHKTIVVSDEIYGPLMHSGPQPSLAEFYPEGTIISGGLSKWCGAGGWRLGTFAFPPQLDWLRKAVAVVASETYTSVSTPIQYAACTAYSGGEEMEDYLVHCRRVLKRVGGFCSRAMQQAGGLLHDPQGAFYLFPDFEPKREALARHGITDSRTLCERLLEATGVAVLPGQAFGRPPEELTLRMAYVDFDGRGALQESAAHPDELPEDFVRDVCPEIHTGITKMADWLNCL